MISAVDAGRRSVAAEILAAARAHDERQSDRLRVFATSLRVLWRGGGLLAIDNVLSHPAEVAAVGELIDAEPAVTSALVPTGAGLRLVVRAP